MATLLVFLFGLSACGGEEPEDEPIPAPDEETVEETQELDEFDPVLEFEDRELVFEDEDYPAYADVELPVVSGIDPDHADAFAQRM